MTRRLDDLPLWKLVLLNLWLRFREWRGRHYVMPLQFVLSCRRQWEVEKPHLEDWP